MHVASQHRTGHLLVGSKSLCGKRRGFELSAELYMDMCISSYIYIRKHILLECPITTELFQKNGYDLNAYNNVRDILYNTDVITDIVKSIVHSPVGKLV